MYHIPVVNISIKYKYYIWKIIAVVQFLLCLLLWNQNLPADLCMKIENNFKLCYILFCIGGSEKLYTYLLSMLSGLLFSNLAMSKFFWSFFVLIDYTNIISVINNKI